MRLSDTLKLEPAAIWATKLRSALPLLGMVIGVTAVVVVVSLIEGIDAYVDERIAGLREKALTALRFALDDFKETEAIAAAQRRNKELTLADFGFLRVQRSQRLVDKNG